jgi:hypothetical protein
MNLSSTWQSIKQHATDHHKKSGNRMITDTNLLDSQSSAFHDSSSSNTAYWKFSQCFGEKEDIPPTHEGTLPYFLSRLYGLCVSFLKPT